MGILTYSKSLVFTEADQTSGKDLLARLRGVIATKRFSDLTLAGDKLRFRNLYLKRLDLLPIPKGWIQVREGQEGLQVTYFADYRWVSNQRGRWLAIIAAIGMLLVTLYKSLQAHQLAGGMPSPLFFLAIPIYVALLWLFVFGLNSWYSRLYLERLIESMMQLRSPALKMRT